MTSPAQAWFKGRDSDATTQAALRDVNEIEGTHALFRQRVDQILGKDKPRRRVTTEEELREQLQDVNPESLRDASTADQDTASLSNYNSHERRRSGSKKFAIHSQQFLKDFADFVDVYSAIISLVKNAGAPYGEAAYETLSLFLVVVVSKSGHDELIGDLLCGLTAAFPRLDVLMSIYPSTTLEKHVAAVYINVIIFARTAADYYATLKVKVLNALGRPPSLAIEKAASTIKGKLAQVNNEAMILLHAESKQALEVVKQLEDDKKELTNKVSGLQQDLAIQVASLQQELTDQVSSLQHSISVLEDGNARLGSELKTVKANNDNLEQQRAKFELSVDHQADIDKEEQLYKIKNALKLRGDPREWPDTNFDAVYDVLCKIFPRIYASPDPAFRHRKSSSDQYLQMTRKIIFRDTEFISWYQSPTSSILFLCGRTRREARTNIKFTSSWLSPAPVFAAKKVHSDIEASRSSGGTHHQQQQPQPQSILSSSASILSTSTSIFSRPAPTSDMSSDLCIYHTCHPESSSPADYDSTRPFSIIAYSLYKWTKVPLPSSDLISRAEAITHKSLESKRAAVGDLTSLLVELLESSSSSSSSPSPLPSSPPPSSPSLSPSSASFPASSTTSSPTIWILLDRLDNCDVELSRLMDQLTRLVTCKTGGGARIKIMVTADWPYEGARWKRSDLESAAEGKVVFKDEWDQKNKDWTGLGWRGSY